MKVVNQSLFAEHFRWITTRWLKTVLGLSALIMLCVVVLLAYGLIQKYHATLNLSQQQAALKTQEISNSIDDKFDKLVLAANDLAENLNQLALNEKVVESTLKKTALNHDGFYALGVAFDLYQLNPQLRLFAPFIRQDGSSYLESTQKQ